MSTPDTRYIPAFSINTIITNKDDAAALANGTVRFFSDIDRSNPKQVYQLAGYPNYFFESLGYELTLSSIGTFVDADGNPVVPYFLPYAADGSEELYYIQCYSEGDVFQFDRQAVPYISTSGDVTSETEFTTINQISNPQFVEKLFESNNYTYSVSGTQTTPIAPGWDLITTGTGTVIVSRLDNIGASQPGSPPFAMQFSTTGLTGTYKLRQRLYQSPRLFYGKYLSAYFVASVSTESTLELKYEPSDGDAYTLILDTADSSGSYEEFSSTTLINQISNVDPATIGYVDITLYIPAGITIAVTDFQILSVADGSAQIGFQQQSTSQQQSFLYWYDRPGLLYKPVKSYLAGWDFPLNPAQFGSTVAAPAIGTNKSQYFWDQTIVFQSSDSGVSAVRAPSGALQLTAAVTTQLAIIQYLDTEQARKALNNPMSVNVSALASATTNSCVSLWYTTDASLPNVASGTNNSLVASLDTNGKPATFNGAWTEVPRSSMGNALLSIGTSATTNFNDYAFTGWDMEGIAACNTATYFAIVMGTASIPAAGTVTFNSVSLVPGVVATIPAPQSVNEVLMDCQYYYETSLNGGGTGSGIGQSDSAIVRLQTAVNMGASTQGFSAPFSVDYQLKRSLTPVVTLYAANDTIPNYVTVQGWANGVAITGAVNDSVTDFWVPVNLGSKAVHYTPGGLTPSVAIITGTPFSNNCSVNLLFHFVADARLGII